MTDIVDGIPIFLVTQPNDLHPPPSFHPKGILEAAGPRLELVTADAAMRRLVGWPAHAPLASLGPGGGGAAAPTVHDLLPEALRAGHRRLIAAAGEAGEIPEERLMHPLRGVPLLRADGSVVKVNVVIGLITKVVF